MQFPIVGGGGGVLLLICSGTQTSLNTTKYISVVFDAIRDHTKETGRSGKTPERQCDTEKLLLASTLDVSPLGN